MLRVGLVGIGFMGWIHYLSYRKTKGVKLAAVCTRNVKRLAGDWRGIQGNFGPAGEQIDLSAVSKYSDFDELLADVTIDLIDICLPPNLHAEASIAALRAGKHVFVEKPMGLTAAECDRIMGAAEKSKKQVLVGHSLPFLPEYAFARKAIVSGKMDRADSRVACGGRCGRDISRQHRCAGGSHRRASCAGGTRGIPGRSHASGL